MPGQLAGSLPKKHHYVPISYMKAWAETGDRVAVLRRGVRDPFPSSIRKLAAEGGLHGIGKVAVGRERMFGRLEEDWPGVREELITSGGLSRRSRDSAALFMALQLVRTREIFARAAFVAELAEYTDERPLRREAVRDFLQDRHLGFAPGDAEVEGAWTIASYQMEHGGPPTRDQVLRTEIQIALTELAPRLSAMRWVVEICRKPILLTSDRPVMYWRPKSPRHRFEGVGLDGAQEVRFPITPGGLLVLRREAQGDGVRKVATERVLRVNADTASQCYEFVLASPSNLASLTGLKLADRRPALRFNMAPGVQVLPDGREAPMGDIVHMYVPLRSD